MTRILHGNITFKTYHTLYEGFRGIDKLELIKDVQQRSSASWLRAKAPRIVGKVAELIGRFASKPGHVLVQKGMA